MATPQQLHEESAAVVALAIRELESLISSLPEEAVREALFDLLPGLILNFAENAAVVAAEWYDEHRLELDVPGNHEAFVPNLRDPGVESLVRWAEREAQSTLTRLSLIEGGVFRRIENGSRAAIIENTMADPQGRGFQRYARVSTTGCGFCQMLAGRGEVYRSAESASFGAHDNCRCVAVPAFDGAPVPVRPYEPTSKNITDADRARVREWLRTH